MFGARTASLRGRGHVCNVRGLSLLCVRLRVEDRLDDPPRHRVKLIEPQDDPVRAPALPSSEGPRLGRGHLGSVTGALRGASAAIGRCHSCCVLHVRKGVVPSSVVRVARVVPVHLVCSYSTSTLVAVAMPKPPNRPPFLSPRPKGAMWPLRLGGQLAPCVRKGRVSPGGRTAGNGYKPGRRRRAATPGCATSRRSGACPSRGPRGRGFRGGCG